jgi:propanediol dehydratase large subunit
MICHIPAALPESLLSLRSENCILSLFRIDCAKGNDRTLIWFSAFHVQLAAVVGGQLRTAALSPVPSDKVAHDETLSAAATHGF